MSKSGTAKKASICRKWLKKVFSKGSAGYELGCELPQGEAQVYGWVMAMFNEVESLFLKQAPGVKVEVELRLRNHGRKSVGYLVYDEVLLFEVEDPEYQIIPIYEAPWVVKFEAMRRLPGLYQAAMASVEVPDDLLDALEG